MCIASTYAAFVYFRLQIRTQYSPRIHQDFVCGFRICDVYPVCRPVSCLPGIRVTQSVLYSIELWTTLALRGLERIQRLTFYLKLRNFLEVWGHDDLLGLVMCFLWLKRSANQIRNCKFYDPTCLEGQYLFPSHSELRNFKPLASHSASIQASVIGQLRITHQKVKFQVRNSIILSVTKQHYTRTRFFVRHIWIGHGSDLGLLRDVPQLTDEFLKLTIEK